MLVSSETGDDAAVYRLPDGTGLVATVDFFTPIVDEAGDWGRIAAANALSDVYAMGGIPRLALAIAGWPVEELPLELLADVLRGGREVAERAGAAIVGGHTITSNEPLYGLIVLGFVELGEIARNDRAAPSMVLFLTKRIGTGMIATAIKRGSATEGQARSAVETMTELNAGASAAMRRAAVVSATDVTGFGLLGHLRTMLETSGCAAEVDAGAVPLLPGVVDLARRDVVAAGTKRNHAWLNETVDWGGLALPEQLVLADAQTSGGLLIATHDPGSLRDELRAEEVPFWEIGRVIDGAPGHTMVLGSLNADGPLGAG